MQRPLAALAGSNRKVGLRVPERYSTLLGAVAAWPSAPKLFGWVFVVGSPAGDIMNFYGLFYLRKFPARNSLFSCWQAFYGKCQCLQLFRCWVLCFSAIFYYDTLLLGPGMVIAIEWLPDAVTPRWVIGPQLTKNDLWTMLIIHTAFN